MLTPADRIVTPWLTVREAAGRAKCGVKTVYREVRAGRLRAARIGGRRELRLRPEWIDEWLDRTSAATAVGDEALTSATMITVPGYLPARKGGP
jgi:excisionase family DNA binding protein